MGRGGNWWASLITDHGAVCRRVRQIKCGHNMPDNPVPLDRSTPLVTDQVSNSIAISLHADRDYLHKLFKSLVVEFGPDAQDVDH